MDTQSGIGQSPMLGNRRIRGQHRDEHVAEQTVRQKLAFEKSSGIRKGSKGFQTRIQLMQQTGQPRALLALLVLPSALVDQGIGEPTASTLRLLISPPQITKLQNL